MRHSIIYTIDMIQAYGFTMMAGVCGIGVIARGAWWHIFTAVALLLLAWASLADARKEERE